MDDEIQAVGAAGLATGQQDDWCGSGGVRKESLETWLGGGLSSVGAGSISSELLCME